MLNFLYKYRTGEVSEQSRELDYRKLLFGLVGTLMVTLLFILQGFLRLEGVPLSLYGGPVSVTLLQTSFVLASQVQ